MKRERLRSLPIEELRRVAARHEIDFEDTIDRESLINLLAEVFEELELERNRSNNHQVKVEAKKYRILEDEEDGDSELPAIPERYNETRLVAMPRDPVWAFAYWEIREDKMLQLKRDGEKVRLVLRVHDIEGVRFNGRNSNSSFDIPVRLTDGRWYINVPRAACTYILELVVKRKREQVLARSNMIRTPREGLSDQINERWLPINGEEILALSVHPSLSEIPGSGSIPQRILAVGN
jgi:hypothetical protein